MTEQEKLNLLEETFEVDEGSIKADMDLADVEGYGSLAKLSLIVMFEDEFDKKLSGDQIKELKTVADVLKLME